jgi:hypothetical protein
MTFAVREVTQSHISAIVGPHKVGMDRLKRADECVPVASAVLGKPSCVVAWVEGFIFLVNTNLYLCFQSFDWLCVWRDDLLFSFRMRPSYARHQGQHGSGSGEAYYSWSGEGFVVRIRRQQDEALSERLECSVSVWFRICLIAPRTSMTWLAADTFILGYILFGCASSMTWMNYCGWQL